MDTRVLVVTLPLPQRSLSPNARCHWRTKAAAVAKYRGEAALAGKAAFRSQGTCDPFVAPKVEPRFYFADRRDRDKDNLLHSLKSAFDGLQDAGIVANDRAFTYLPVVIGIDKDDPRVELWVSEEMP